MGSIRRFKRQHQRHTQKLGYEKFLPGDYIILSQQIGFCDPGLYKLEAIDDGSIALSIGDIVMTTDSDTLDYCAKTNRPSKSQIQQRIEEHMKFFINWQKDANLPPLDSAIVKGLTNKDIETLLAGEGIESGNPGLLC